MPPVSSLFPFIDLPPVVHHVNSLTILLEFNAGKDLRSFQRELNDDAPHDIVKLVILPRTERVFIVTGYAGFRDRFIRKNRFKVTPDHTRMYGTWIIRHHL